MIDPCTLIQLHECLKNHALIQSGMSAARYSDVLCRLVGFRSRVNGKSELCLTVRLVGPKRAKEQSHTLGTEVNRLIIESPSLALDCLPRILYSVLHLSEWSNAVFGIRPIIMRTKLPR